MPLHITWISASFIIYSLRTTSTEYCPDGLFTCTNGKCIEDDRVCDVKMDCTDRTDESGCGCREADLGLVIDSSGSITSSDFKDGLSFLSNFLSFFDIGPGPSQGVFSVYQHAQLSRESLLTTIWTIDSSLRMKYKTMVKIRVAAVIYGKGVYANGSFSLDTYSSKKEVLNAIRRIPYHAGGGNDTGQAIQSMRENQMSRVRDFPVRKIMIVLTDGNSDNMDITAEQANTTRQQGFTIFSVGVGNDVSEVELMNIAGSPDRILESNSYHNLRNFRDVFVWKVCGEVGSPGTLTVQNQHTEGIFLEHTQSTETPVTSSASISIACKKWERTTKTNLEYNYSYVIVGTNDSRCESLLRPMSTINM